MNELRAAEVAALESMTKKDLAAKAKAAGWKGDEARAPKNALIAELIGIRTLSSKFPGTCADCGKPFAAGDWIAYDKTGDKGHKAAHVDCAIAAYYNGSNSQEQQQADGLANAEEIAKWRAEQLEKRQEFQLSNDRQEHEAMSHIDRDASQAIAAQALGQSAGQSAERSEGIAAAESVKKTVTAAPVAPVEAAQQLLGLVQSLAGAALNEDAVRSIVKAEIAKAPALKIEIHNHNNGHQHSLEGLHHPMLPTLIKCLSVPRVNVWLAGPAGSGKTTLAQSAADALGLPFLMNGALLAKHEVAGFVDAGGRIVSTPFREAWTNGGIYLMDEADGSSPAAFLAMNAALAGGLAEFPGDAMPVPRHENFRCIVAANTWGAGANGDYCGRNKIDAATLDRFVFLPVDYDERLELAVAGNEKWTKYVQKVRAAARQRGKKVIVSPRASIYGAQLLAAGIDLETVKGLALFNRMTADDRKELEAA